MSSNKLECEPAMIRSHERDVLFRDTGAALLHSPSSGGDWLSLGGPMSPLGRELPNRLPGPSGAAFGLNLLPIVHVSSVSAGPGAPPSLMPEPRRGAGPESESNVREGRDERQSEAPSETEGGGGPSRLRGPSRELSESGRGPSRLQGPENFASSSKPPLPKPRSFAIETILRHGDVRMTLMIRTRLGHTDADGAPRKTLRTKKVT